MGALLATCRVANPCAACPVGRGVGGSARVACGARGCVRDSLVPATRVGPMRGVSKVALTVSICAHAWVFLDAIHGRTGPYELCMRLTLVSASSAALLGFAWHRNQSRGPCLV